MSGYLRENGKRLIAVVSLLAILFSCMPMPVVFAESVISTDKDVYEIGDPIFVTANTDIDGAWVSLLCEEDSNSAKSWYWYYVNGSYQGKTWTKGETYNIFQQVCSAREGYTSTWNLPAGNYKVVILHGDYELVVSKSIAIVSGTTPKEVSTDKTTYTGDEPINASSISHELSGEPWVALYHGTKELTDSFGNDYLAYFYCAGINGIDINLKSLYPNFEDGDYTVVLFDDSGYSKPASVAHFSVQGSVIIESTLSVDKTEYKYGEAINVTATSPYEDNDAWVGLYVKDTTIGDGSVPSITYYYLKDHHEETVNLLSLMDGSLDPGTYWVVLFMNGGYAIDTIDGKLAIKTIVVDRVYDDPVWNWADDGKSASAIFTATDDTTEKQTLTGEVSEKAKTPATCVAEGSVTYEAVVTVTEDDFITDSGETEFTDTKTVAIPIDSEAHKWGEWIIDKEATEEEEGQRHRVCQNDPEHVETEAIPKLSHTHTLVHHAAAEATCEENGNIEFWECSGCGKYFSDANGENEIEKNTVVIEALGHKWGAWTHSEQNGTHTHSRTCENDSEHVETGNCTLEVTSNANGVLTYTCSKCGFSYTETVLSTDATEYELGAPITVTTNYVAEGAWVGLYKLEDSYGGSTLSFYWYNVDANVHNILAETSGGRDDFTAGDYKVVLFADSGYSAVTTVEIKINEPSGYKITTEKDEFEMFEPIMVTVEGAVGKDWIGLYKKGETPSGSTASFFWYYPASNPNPYNILLGGDNQRPSEFTAGEYSLILLSNDGYDVIAKKDIVIKGLAPRALTLDNNRVLYKHALNVTATSGYPGAWVGVYDYDFNDNLSTDGALKCYYYVGDVGSGTAVDLWDIDGSNVLTAGHYKFILFTSGYDIDRDENNNLIIRGFYVDRAYGDPEWSWDDDGKNASAIFTATDDTTEKQTLTGEVSEKAKTPATCVAEGSVTYEAVVTVTEDDFITDSGETEFTDTKTVAIPIDSEAHKWGEWIIDKEATEEEEGQRHRVCQNDPEHVETEAIPKLSHTHTLVHHAAAEATCEENGNIEFWECSGCGKYFSDANGENEIEKNTVVIEALGHKWGAWSHNENGTHSRICTNDSSHVQTESCTFEVTSNKNGVLKYTCSKCGFSYTETVLSTDRSSYLSDNPIMVTTNYNGDGAWVGIYKEADVIDDGSTTYFYKIEVSSAAKDIKKGQKGDRDFSEFTTGDYKVVLFKDSGLNILTEVKIEIDMEHNGHLKTDKTTYAVGEPIMVDAQTSGQYAWVGFYQKNDKPGDPNSGYDMSIYWYYLSEEENPTNILATRDENSRGHLYGPGQFKIVLFGTTVNADGSIDYYSPIIDTVYITITNEEIEADAITLTMNDVQQTNGMNTQFDLGDDIKLVAKTDGVAGMSWVGIYYDNTYNIYTDFDTVESNKWFYVSTYNGEPYVLKDLHRGVYTVAVFGNNKKDDVRMVVNFEIVAPIEHEEILYEPTCEETGLKEVFYADGGQSMEIIPALGHAYEEKNWSWKEDYSEATLQFVCSRDTNHVKNVEATVTTKTTAATTEKEGSIVYTATAEFEGNTYYDQKTVVIPKLKNPKLVAVYNSARGADLRFETVKDVVAYKIMRKENGVWSCIATVKPGDLEINGDECKYFDETVADKYGKGFIYSVAAVLDGAETDYDTLGLPLYRLAKPEITDASRSGDTSITVTWKKVDAHGYELQYSADKGKTWVKVPDTKETTVTLENMDKSITYYFRLRDFKDNADRGRTYSQFSDWASEARIVVPVLANIYNSANGGDIRWKPDSNKQYVIMRKENGVWKEVKTVNAADLEKDGGNYKYIDGEVKNSYGKGYIYSVAVKDKNGKLYYDTKGLALYRLDVPTIKSAKAAKQSNGKYTITLEWKKVDAHGYEVQYSTDGGKTWAKLSQTTDTKLELKDLDAGKQYVFRVRCQKTNKDRGTTWSQYSKWASANTK